MAHPRIDELKAWPVHRLAARCHILETSNRKWAEAARKALDGDASDLRYRLEGFDNPLELVLSELDKP